MKNKLGSPNRILHSMFVENTGVAMCDSGGENDRRWQKNQGRSLADFNKEPSVTFDMPKEKGMLSEIMFTISSFHYLKGQLGVDDLCRTFNRLNKARRTGGVYEGWDSEEFYGVYARANEMLTNTFKKSRDTVNTYNGDSNLSQILQYTHVTLGKECYVVLQVHGGADARGGYTDARLFKLASEYNYDGGFMSPEDVYGVLTRKNGTELKVGSGYHGYNLSLEDGEDAKFDPKTDKLDLYQLNS